MTNKTGEFVWSTQTLMSLDIWNYKPEGKTNLQQWSKPPLLLPTADKQQL